MSSLRNKLPRDWQSGTLVVLLVAALTAGCSYHETVIEKPVPTAAVVVPAPPPPPATVVVTPND
jgi:hypothetical protein